ncbi:MAG TPA: hypothetical protein VKB21_02745, partial [Candidatus Acidoferrum sp.]|nr:hypothetical protein [Candidatus Acidoferrum sp.]
MGNTKAEYICICIYNNSNKADGVSVFEGLPESFAAVRGPLLQFSVCGSSLRRLGGFILVPRRGIQQACLKNSANGCWDGLLTLFGSVPELEGRNAWRNMTLRSSEVARVGTWARFAPVN